tara:strand:- start:296 stop:427 length:132 start_codon:yes stop_codon:yes gene_type:complete
MSIYYTLQQCMVIFYLVFLLSAISAGIFDELLGFGEDGGDDSR